MADGRLLEVLQAWRAVDVFAPAIWAIRPWSPHVPLAVAALVAPLRVRLGGQAQA